MNIIVLLAAPCRLLFIREVARPVSDFAPVDLAEFLLFASRIFSVTNRVRFLGGSACGSSTHWQFRKTLFAFSIVRVPGCSSSLSRAGRGAYRVLCREMALLHTDTI